MKIAYICSDVDVELLGYEGCSVHIREFTNALVDAGHDVFIICAWLGESKHIQTNARVYHLEAKGSHNTLWECLCHEPLIQTSFLDRDLKSILWNTWLQIEGSAILERENPDFLYERYALFGFGGLELCRRKNKPLILELNAPLCDQQQGYEKFPLIQTARQLESHIICRANAIVALTDWLANWAVGLGADRNRIHVFPDAVSNRLFGGQIDRISVRQKLAIENNQVIGFMGSFHHWHDVSGLIDAFAQLHSSKDSLRLLLVGGGQDRKAMEQRCRVLGLSNAVRFTGKVPHDEIPKYLAAMDVAVVPYRPIENFFFSPMKLFECMAVGCPVVAADLGQISQIIDHRHTGWLYTPGDNKQLATGIATLLADHDLAAQIGSAARNYVLRHFTWEKITGDIVELAKTLLR
jgi:glycosyltransferase involved in cell wall biosynthesis